MKKTTLLLIFVILLAIVLRFFQLGSVPPSPDWDEVALGWNGYSIMMTGKDEYGKFLPVVLRSFDDYKPALYAYLTIPFTALLGLTTMATRMPSAVFGVLTVLAIYLLIKEISKKEYLALLVAFLLAISPWHIQFSRIAFETNVGLSFNVFMALFFIKGLKKPGLLSLSAIFAALSIYTYQSEKVFTPLLALGLVIIYAKELLELPRKYLIFALIAGVIAIAPMAHYIITNEESLLRAKATIAFSEQNFLNRNIQRLEADISENNILGKILDNRRIVYGITIASGYLSHMNLNWLFIEGDLQRHHAPQMGILYLWELPFVFIGIYSLIFTSGIWFKKKKSALFIFLWFLLAAAPASITSGVPHAVRTLNFLPTFQVFTAIGLITVFGYLVQKKYLSFNTLNIKSLVIISSFFFIFAVNFLFYLNQYFVQQNYFYSYDWQYGHEEAVAYVKSVESKYDKIVLTEEEPMDQAYMFYLFYLKYSPERYQMESKTTSGGFEDNHNFDKYEFRPINWKEEVKDSKTLYVGRPSDFSSGAKILKVIKYLNGEQAIIIVEG